MITDLRGLQFGPKDVVFDTGRSTSGDYICVRHLPTGIASFTMDREITHEDLLDAVLKELYSSKVGGDSRIGNRG